MKQKRIPLLLVAVLSLFLLSSCKGHPIPDGMEEEQLFDAGREIVSLLNAEDYDAVYASFRPDIQSLYQVSDIATLMGDTLSAAGPYVHEDRVLATGQTDQETEEFYAIAVLLCEHKDEDVLYRLAFDTEYMLIGMSIGVQ